MDDQRSSNNDSKLKTISLSDIRSRHPVERDRVKQSFAHGRSKTVEVEVRRRSRTATNASSQEDTAVKKTNDEFEARLKAVQEAMRQQQQRQEEVKVASEEAPVEAISEPAPEVLAEVEVAAAVVEEVSTENPVEQPKEEVVEVPVSAPVIAQKPSAPHQQHHRPGHPMRKVSMEPRQSSKRKTFDDITPIVLKANEYQKGKPAATVPPPVAASNAGRKETKEEIPEVVAIGPNPDKVSLRPGKVGQKRYRDQEEDQSTSKRSNKFDDNRKFNRHDITQALDDNYDGEGRRRRQKRHKANASEMVEPVKIVRDVTIFDMMTVADLANRMSVRAAELVKLLMKMGKLVTVNEPLDIDTAELLCVDLGHTYKRVADSDVEEGLMGEDDADSVKLPRPPIVTVMGHVDHGKTSLLDALRQTDVVSGEAGGITQHIGAYQVTLGSGARKGQKITFIDTPGHAAFSSMRARGANMTDVVVLVVAADDGIKEQTVEALRHAQAAKVPIVVAINKMDKPDAQPDRVRADLMQYELVVEEFGGDVLSVEVSAKQRKNLEALEEAILLQAEILDLKANPNRSAEGVVIEARMDKGRGTLATVLVRRGTLRTGDIVVAGTQWGRVRTLVNDHGQRCDAATPGMPVEVVGFSGVPSAGDELAVVDSEARAREVAEYRQQRQRLARAASLSGMDKMLSRIAEVSGKRELAILIKGDVQGSVEAIASGLAKLGNDEVAVRILHSAVGGINESDIALARASSAMVLAFNVRPNTQARDLAKQDSIEIRTYSVIYDLFDDMKAMLGGMLAPTLRDKELGRVEIREVFSVAKVGKIAGCYVLDGLVKRGSKIRLLRDNVVIYEGELKTLKRFKDDVKEVKEGYECGLSIEGYNDIQVGDVLECFEIESVARQLGS